MPARLRIVGARSTNATRRSVLPPGCVFLGRELPPFFGNRNDHWHVQAGVVRRAFAAGHAGAVVAEVEDDRVVGQAVGFQLAEDLPRLAVHFGELVVVLRPVAADFGRVRVVCGHANLSRIVHGSVRPQADLAFVRGGEIEHCEKRLAIAPPAPVGTVARFVPHATIRLHVVIFFRVVRAVVAGLAQVLRQQADGVRQRARSCACAGRPSSWGTCP